MRYFNALINNFGGGGVSGCACVCVCVCVCGVGGCVGGLKWVSKQCL